MYDVCITMVNTNEQDDIERCLDSLYRDMKGSTLKWTVVLVDNASDVDIEPILKEKFPEVKLVRQEKNEGFGKSHNRAIKHVDAKYYFVLNPDTTFENGGKLVERLHEFMENRPEVGMSGPKIVYPDGSLQYSCWRFPTFLQPIFSRTKWGKKGKGKETADRFMMKDFDHKKTLPVDAIMGSAMFVRKNAINEIGGFDDLFWMYFEDIDWCKRMWEEGWPVYYVHDIVLNHFHRRASAQVPGVINALVKNKYARVHFLSWFKYFWKWRGNHKYYGEKI